MDADRGRLRVDVVLDAAQQIVAAFGGEILSMHAEARATVRASAMVPVPAPFDVVVTTNGGYPLDQNLYQTVKGISAAATVVRPGGAIVAAAECRDGFPDHGSFREVLASAATAKELLSMFMARERTVTDQWQVQVLARVLDRAKVSVFNSYLSADDLASAHLDASSDVAATVRTALAAAGPDARVCVLPEGPQTIPYLSPAGV